MNNINDTLITNKDYIDDFISTIEKEFNLHTIDRWYDTGYYVDTEDISICGFKIKEIPDFTFGIWMSSNIDLNYYDKQYQNSKLIFFTQPTINIDKFKPSRSSFCLPIERYIECNPDTDESFYTWWLTEVELMIRALRKHKIKSFYKADWSGWSFYDDVSYFKALKYYINSYYLYYKEILKDIYKSYKLIKIIKRKFKKLSGVYVYLYKMDNVFPRMNLIYSTKPNISDKDNNKLTNISNFLDKNYFMDLSCHELSEEDYFNHIKTINGEEDIKILWKMD